MCVFLFHQSQYIIAVAHWCLVATISREQHCLVLYDCHLTLLRKPSSLIDEHQQYPDFTHVSSCIYTLRCSQLYQPELTYSTSGLAYAVKVIPLSSQFCHIRHCLQVTRAIVVTGGDFSNIISAMLVNGEKNRFLRSQKSVSDAKSSLFRDGNWCGKYRGFLSLVNNCGYWDGHRKQYV